MIIYLSAIETAAGQHAAAAAAAGAQHVLTSFYHAGWKHRAGASIPIWEACLRQARLRLLDSGAFTFRTASLGLGNSAQGALNTDYDLFLAMYLRWISALSRAKLADFWVEVDIGLVVGSSWVIEQRRQMIASGLGHGLIQVWHADEHDWDYWLWMLREASRPGRSNYVGIEGHNGLRANHDYSRFLYEAYRRGVRVHTFKITDHEGLKRHPFYSIDSTSWIAPTLYGSPPVSLRSGGVTLSNDSEILQSGGRSVWRSEIRIGEDAQTRMHLLKKSAQAWIQAERQLTDLWRSRGIDWDSAIANPELRET